ncbi:MAG: universal stress protein [Deltaproteobacteria bacterium]
MALFKQILIPVDFSTHSTAAVLLGADVATRFQSSVTLLHVHDPLPYALPPEYEIYSPEQRKRILAELEKGLVAAKRRAETAGALSVQTQLIEGTPSRAIAEFAATKHFDLIVIGTHGRRGLQHALLGSVAERVVRTAPCPVLTVRSPEDPASEAAKVWPPAL